MTYTPKQIRLCADAKEAIDKGLPAEQCHEEHTEGKWKPFTNQFTMQYGWLYRPKPVPKTRQWSKPDDVPGPVSYIRRKRSILPAYPGSSMIISANEYGPVYVARIGADPNSATLVRSSWDELKDYEHSTDRKTWHPCEIEEENP